MYFRLALPQREETSSENKTVTSQLMKSVLYFVPNRTNTVFFGNGLSCPSGDIFSSGVEGTLFALFILKDCVTFNQCHLN